MVKAMQACPQITNRPSPPKTAGARSISAIREWRALAEAGIAALLNPDAAAPRHEPVQILFQRGHSPSLISPGQPNQPFSASAIAAINVKAIDLVFSGSSAVDLAARAPDGERAKAMIDCENALMAVSPFPDELALGFWRAHREDDDWHVTGAVVLADPVIEILEMIRKKGIKITAVRRALPDGSEWASVPPWIRPKTQKRLLMRLPPAWLLVTLAIAMASGLSLSLKLMEQRQALAVAESSSSTNRAAIARARQYIRNTVEVSTIAATSRQRLALPGALAAQLPETIWFEGMSINLDQIELTGKAESALKALEFVARTPGIADARFATAVTRDRNNGGERFVIQAVLGVGR